MHATVKWVGNGRKVYTSAPIGAKWDRFYIPRNRYSAPILPKNYYIVSEG